MCVPVPCSCLATLTFYLIFALRVCFWEMFCYIYVFSFPPGVYVGTLNLIASIHGPSMLTLPYSI